MIRNLVFIAVIVLSTIWAVRSTKAKRRVRAVFLWILAIILSLYYGYFLIIPIPRYLPYEKTWSTEYKHKSLGPRTYYRFRIPKAADDVSKSVEEAVTGLGEWERTSTTTSDRILSEFRKSQGDMLSSLPPDKVVEMERYEVMRASGARRSHGYRGTEPFVIHTWFRHEPGVSHRSIAVKVSSVGGEECVLELWDSKYFDH